MKFYHVTSAFVAQRFLQNPEFIPQNDPSSHVYGLHGYSFRNGYFFDQVPANQGVKLVLKWHGDVEERSLHDPRAIKDNVLYVQFPWRVYLQGNHDEKNLQILGVLNDGCGSLAEQLGVNLTQAWLSPADYKQVVKAKCHQFLSKYWRKCREEKRFLQIKRNKEISIANKLHYDNRELAAHLKFDQVINDERQAQRVAD